MRKTKEMVCGDRNQNTLKTLICCQIINLKKPSMYIAPLQKMVILTKAALHCPGINGTE